MVQSGGFQNPPVTGVLNHMLSRLVVGGLRGLSRWNMRRRRAAPIDKNTLDPIKNHPALLVQGGSTYISGHDGGLIIYILSRPHPLGSPLQLDTPILIA